MADLPTYTYGEVGEWVGCGFDTIPVLFPPPTILGYDACVTPIVQGTSPIVIV
jgi:hypothetical protein